MTETASSPGSAWLEIVGRPTLDAFAQAFSSTPTLEATVSPAPLTGARPIYEFFRATRSMYDSIGFVNERHCGRSVWLEWTGVFHGRAMSGATVLTYDSRGAIEHIRLYHFPHPQVGLFADELRNKLTQDIEALLTSNGTQHEDVR
jgi:hypothetical protein